MNNVCPTCGNKGRQQCPHCGKSNNSENIKCYKCGKILGIIRSKHQMNQIEQRYKDRDRVVI